MPLSPDEFFDVFATYNESIWPLQLALLSLGALAVGFVFMERRDSGQLSSGILSLLWLWAGVVYHLMFFRAINPIAVLFGALFIVQAALLAWYGVWRKELTFQWRADAATRAGALLVLYALLIYPALGYVLGHEFPRTPTFGLPCPLTIFTLGMLLWVRGPAPWRLLVIPIAWAIVGTSGAILFGVFEDFGLVAAVALLVARSGSPHAYATS